MAVNIGFAIWGVRDGFEIMLASNPTEAEFLKADVITDKMRGVCNVASRRFYSLHRNSRFAVATIYDTDVIDIFDRNAYIAITLYIPLTQIFKGNAIATLNRLMDFYILKQGDSRVNMFTDQMIFDQYSALTTEPYTGKLIQGGKLGYFNYETEDEIVDRFDQVNIEGFKAVFFLPPGNQNTVQQLTGYEQVTNFHSTSRISFESYNPEMYTVYHNSRVVSGPAGTLHIDGLPGEKVVIADKKTGRQKTLEITKQDQSHLVWTILPIQHSPEPEIVRKPKEPNRNVLMLSIVLFSLVVLGSILYIFRDEILHDVDNGHLPVEITDSTTKTPTVEADQTKDTDRLIDTTITYNVKAVYKFDKLDNDGREILKTLVGEKLIIKVNPVGDIITVTIKASKKDFIDSLKQKISQTLLSIPKTPTDNQDGVNDQNAKKEKKEKKVKGNNKGNQDDFE